MPYLHRDADETAAAATAGIEVGDVDAGGRVRTETGEFYWLLAIPLTLLALLELAWTIRTVARSGVGSASRRPTAREARRG